MWNTMDSFPYPAKEWDYSQPKFLFFSAGEIRLGRCFLQDSEDGLFSFQDDSCCGHTLEPTHWMFAPGNPDGC